MKLKVKEIRLPYVFVVGNEKGGAGKTTFSMHLIASLLEKKLRVCSIDTDSRQHSLTNYIQNRQVYNTVHQERSKVPIHQHFLITENVKAGDSTVEKDKCVQFERIMSRLQSESEVIVIDTPGSHSEIACLAHSYADTIITPINDSFLDIDVLAKVDPYNLRVISPSIYSQMVWEQKMRKSQRDGTTMDWVVVRNRLSNLDAVNKRNVNYVLEQLATRICFKNIPGFSERVIFRELFLQGITLLDLHKRKSGKDLSLSHVAARQELREFIQHLNLDSIIDATHKPRLYNIH